MGAINSASKVDLLQASEIECRPIDWIWPGWLASGKLHLLAGAPGTGKTTIALQLAASISVGASFPDGSRAKAGNVLIWSGEDDPADTLVPRLQVAGADLKRVFFVGDVCDRRDWRRSFDPATDLPMLQQRASEIGCIAMVVLDPVVSAVSGDSHKNSEVRRGLQPVVDFAHGSGAAVLGISHFSKGTGGRDPLERVTGSVAFGALARVVMVTTRRCESGGGPDRILARAKSNIGPDDSGFEYSVKQVQEGGLEASVIHWGQSLDGTARELINSAEGAFAPTTGSMLNEAACWLSRELEGGPCDALDVETRAQGAGIARRTLDRAKRTIGVRSVKDGKGGSWRWQLPNEGEPCQTPSSFANGSLGNL